MESHTASRATSVRSSPRSTEKTGGELHEKPYYTTMSSATSRNIAPSNRSWSTPHLSPVSNKSSKTGTAASPGARDEHRNNYSSNQSFSPARRELGSLLRAAEAHNAMLERSSHGEEDSELLQARLSRFQFSLQEHGSQHSDPILNARENSHAATRISRAYASVEMETDAAHSSTEMLSRGGSPPSAVAGAVSSSSINENFLKAAEEMKATLAVRSAEAEVLQQRNTQLEAQLAKLEAKAQTAEAGFQVSSFIGVRGMRSLALTCVMGGSGATRGVELRAREAVRILLSNISSSFTD
eukprot:2683183-Rhodomonas_salina.2